MIYEKLNLDEERALYGIKDAKVKLDAFFLLLKLLSISIQL